LREPGRFVVSRFTGVWTDSAYRSAQIEADLKAKGMAEVRVKRPSEIRVRCFDPRRSLPANKKLVDAERRQSRARLRVV
jgi:hypothetical protein